LASCGRHPSHRCHSSQTCVKGSVSCDLSISHGYKLDIMGTDSSGSRTGLLVGGACCSDLEAFPCTDRNERVAGVGRLDVGVPQSESRSRAGLRCHQRTYSNKKWTVKNTKLSSRRRGRVTNERLVSSPLLGSSLRSLFTPWREQKHWEQ